MSPTASERIDPDTIEDQRVRQERSADASVTDAAPRTVADGLAVSHRKIVQRRSAIALQRDAGNRAVTALLDRTSGRAESEDDLDAPGERDAAEGASVQQPAPVAAGQPTVAPLQRSPATAPPAPAPTTAPASTGTAPAPPIDKEKAKKAATAIFDQHLGNPVVDTAPVEKQVEQGKKEGEFLTQAGVQNRPALAAIVQQTAGGGASSGGDSAPASAPTTAPAAPTTAPAAPTTASAPTTAPAAPTTAPAAPTTAPAAPTTASAPTTAPAAPTTASAPTTAPAAPTTASAPTTAPGTAAATAAAPAKKSGGFFSGLGDRIKGFFGFGKKEGEGYEHIESAHTATESAQNLAENFDVEFLGEGAKAAVEVGGHVLSFINVFKIIFDARAAYKSHVAAQSLDQIAADIQATNPTSPALHEAVVEAAKAKYGERLERVKRVALSTTALVGGVTLFFTGMTLASNPVGWAILSAMAAAGLVYLLYRFIKWLVSEDPNKAKRENLAKTVLDAAAGGDTNGLKALDEIVGVKEAKELLAAYVSTSPKQKSKAIKRVAKHLGE